MDDRPDTQPEIEPCFWDITNLKNDYLRILNQSGWQETHIFQAPLSSEHFKENIVSAMQKKKNNRCNQQVRHHFKEKIGL